MTGSAGFDALSSDLPYRNVCPAEKCFSIPVEGRGSQFDPDALDAFFRASEQIIDRQLALMNEVDSCMDEESVEHTNDQRRQDQSCGDWCNERTVRAHRARLQCRHLGGL